MYNNIRGTLTLITTSTGDGSDRVRVRVRVKIMKKSIFTCILHVIVRYLSVTDI